LEVKKIEENAEGKIIFSDNVDYREE